jgi:hypothetical protein
VAVFGDWSGRLLLPAVIFSVALNGFVHALFLRAFVWFGTGSVVVASSVSFGALDTVLFGQFSRVRRFFVFSITFLSIRIPRWIPRSVGISSHPSLPLI